VTGITIALSKGRIFEETLPLLAAAGIVPADDPETSRKLILGTNRADVRLVIVRASDTPTYVQYGAADLGIAGKDVLIEHGGAGLYQPLDLKIARCRMAVAVPNGFDYAAAVQAWRPPARGDQVHPDGARALRRQGRACRPHQALRLDGTGAAGGTG
jgi:ATP phosphoribosyltransferase